MVSSLRLVNEVQGRSSFFIAVRSSATNHAAGHVKHGPVGFGGVAGSVVVGALTAKVEVAIVGRLGTPGCRDSKS